MNAVNDAKKIAMQLAEIEKEWNDLRAELDEVENELDNMCDCCDELVDMGGEEDYCGAWVHHEDWCCPYELDRRSKYDVCPARHELEERQKELDAKMGMLDAKFYELEELAG